LEGSVGLRSVDGRRPVSSASTKVNVVQKNKFPVASGPNASARQRQQIDRRRFLESVSRVVPKDTAAELFDLFSRIAVLRYEEAEPSGLLLLARLDAQRELPLLRIEKPFDVRDVRGVRKMLHISHRELCVVCDGRSVYGFAQVDFAAPEALLVEFGDQGFWELQERGVAIARIDSCAGQPPRLSLTEERFRRELRTVFDGLEHTSIDTLWRLIAAAQRQTRGTNVLISANAAEEAGRLESQCTGVRPIELTPFLMERLTSVDGTVIIDTRGVCHALGAILDGPVSARGDRTRGGRYNSALMYVDSCPFRCCIVVVSQDGMVDLVRKQ
jgi:DisA bacterial checkpoint controller nucleotide-binding